MASGFVKAELSTCRHGRPQVSCRLLLVQTRNVGLVTDIPTAEYLSAWQVLGNLEIAEVLRDCVASNPQREQICLVLSS